VPSGDAGSWRIEVAPSPSTPAPTEGEYGLVVVRATGEDPPFVVTGTSPSAGSITLRPTDVVVGFNQDVYVPTLTPGELEVNGVPALSFSLVNGTTVDWKINPASISAGIHLPNVVTLGADSNGQQVSDVSFDTLVPYSFTMYSDSILPTTTTLTDSNAGPLYYGRAETFTAQVVNTDTSATPTGLVSFYSGTQLIGRAAVNSSGHATLVTSSLAGGTHTITADYGGTSLFESSVSSGVSLTVDPAVTRATLEPASATTTYGQPVTFTVHDSDITSTPVPTGGTVMFYSGDMPGNPAELIGTAPLINGVATFTTQRLPAGTNQVTAIYEGNANFNGAETASVLVTVAPVGTDTTLTSTASGSITYGTPVTFTVTVTDPDTGLVPNGIVEFLDGTTVIGEVGLNGRGTAALTRVLARGSHAIQAVYLGTSNYVTSQSGTVNLSVS
jgi:hypothetical protein